MKLTEAYTKVPAAKQKKFINRLSNELIKQFEQIYSPTRKIRWDMPNTMSAIAEKEGIDYENLSDRTAKKLAMAAFQEANDYVYALKDDNFKATYFRELVKKYYNEIKSGKIRV